MDYHWQEISSPQNPKIKEVARLRNERHRKKHQRILVDGVREIVRACRAGFEMESLFLCTENREHDLGSEFWDVVRPSSSFRLTGSAFKKIAFGDRNEGVVALFVEKKIELAELPLRKTPLVIVLDGVEKPGNVGAVFRTASAAGLDAIILTNELCHPFNPNAVRASLGTVFELPFASDSIESVSRYLESNDVRIMTTRVESTTDYTNFDYTCPTAIVMGSESEGVSEKWQGYESVSIPMSRSIDSLNISATAAIVTFEAIRQRKQS